MTQATERVVEDIIPAGASQAAAAARSGALTAVGVLLFCCVLWGLSFPVMQIATTAFAPHLGAPEGPAAGWQTGGTGAAFNAVRFGLAALVYAGLTWQWQRGFRRAEVVGGALVGLCLTAGMWLQVTGLCWTRPSVSAFLTALAVVFTPLGQWLVLRRQVSWALWGAVAVALAGMVLLAWPNPQATGAHTLTGVAPLAHLGEILTVLSAVAFTGQILLVDRLGGSASVPRLTLVMFATTGLASAVIVLGLCGPRLWAGTDWAGLAHQRELWWSLPCLVVLCSVTALHLMNRYQPRVAAAAAGVIYCAEPLFGTLFSLLFATERLTWLTVLGGAVTLAAVLLAVWQSAGGGEKSEERRERSDKRLARSE